MRNLYESILSRAQLTESIFSVGDPSAAKKAINTTRIENIKNNIFPRIISGESLLGTRTSGGGLDKNLTITDDNILNISKLRRPKYGYTTIRLDDRCKKLFDENNITGINFIPLRAGNITSESTLCLYTSQNIDLGTHMGPFEIINSKCMFTDYKIGHPGSNPSDNIGCIKNLKLSAATETNRITIYNCMLDNCDLGPKCREIYFVLSRNDLRPTPLSKNIKLEARYIKILIREITDIKIFREWKDYLFDGSDLRKDLMVRLGLDKNKFNKFEMGLYYKTIQNIETIRIISGNRSLNNPPYIKIGEYSIPGILEKVSVYTLKK